MRANIKLGIALSLILSFAVPAQDAQELYQRGLVQEHSRGHLSEAIELYRQAGKAAGKDRTLAAKALIRIAASAEKLGHQSQAMETYAEVVRSYPEQRAEASIAQDRLKQLRRALPASSQKSQTPVLTDVSNATAPLFETYCASCHNATNRAAGLDLGFLNARNVSENASMWETILRRLRARRDPPPYSPRPDDKTYRSVISKLEQALDGAYSANSTVDPAEQVTDAEWASRIAALIWGAGPDASLLEDARNGGLRNPAVLNRQVIRMLRDPRSVHLVSNFLEPWLQLNRPNRTPIDSTVFPQVDAELLQSMETETRLFLESQIREDRGVLEMWTATYTFVNDRLARHYGMPGVSGKMFRRVSWRDTNRAGILGMSGPLAATSTPSRTSPTVRGIYVFRKFLGMDPPDPPANVPPIAESPNPPGRSMRIRLTAHLVNPSCANCHAFFDPLGFALENFDATGQWRNTESGEPINASGTFVDGTRFDGPAELRTGLLKYRDAYYANVSQQLLAHALNRKGRPGRLYDHEMPSVRAIVRSAAAKDYRWSSIIAGVITSAPFKMKNIVP